MITSSQNPKIKWLQTLQARSRERRQARLFVAEGVRLLEEALAAGWQAQAVFYSEELGERGRQVLERFAAQGAELESAAPHVLAAASDTETPQGILAVIQMKELPVSEKLDFAFIPDGVRDPGNLGTMLRTAEAAGVGAVWLPPGSVDPYAPKVLRAGMGAHFRLPIQQVDWQEIQRQATEHQLRVYLAESSHGQVYTQADFISPLALIVGSETQGASDQAGRIARAHVQIPMPGGSESLNAAIAAGILLFEVVRQRDQRLRKTQS